MTVLITVGVLIWAIVRLFASVLEPKFRKVLFLYRLGGIGLAFFVGCLVENGSAMFPIGIDPRLAPILGGFCWGALFLLFDWLAGQKLKEMGIDDGHKMFIKKDY